MTALIVTVTPSAGFVSQDTIVAFQNSPVGLGAEFGVTDDHVDAMRGTFVGDGKPPVYSVAGHTSKVVLIPHMLIAAGMSGGFNMASAWRGALQSAFKVADVDDLNRLAPAALGELRGKLGDAGPFLACHVGWSTTAGRVVGYAYHSDQGFKPQSLTGGHTLSPPLNPKDPEYGDAAVAFTPAANGHGVEAFHVLAAWNQFRAFEAGLFREGVVIGGHLTTARVDRYGVSVQRSVEFPNLAAEGTVT